VLDERVAHDLRVRGAAVVGPLLDGGQLALLRRAFDELVDPASIGDGWFTTGMVTDPERRSAIFERVGSIVSPAISRVVQSGATDIMAGHFHVNPSSGVGGLGPHQDVAIVDERRARSLNAWIPLEDSDLTNGTLRVVDGSHRLGNHDRSLAMPWAFEGLHDLFWELARPLVVPAGTLVLFDTATVHCSGGNRSGATRLAVNALLTPRDVPLIHLVADDRTPAGQVEIYEVSIEHYVSGDLTDRPDTRGGPALTRQVSAAITDPEQIRAVCAMPSAT
jgi:hypothetical protein